MEIVSLLNRCGVEATQPLLSLRLRPAVPTRESTAASMFENSLRFRDFSTDKYLCPRHIFAILGAGFGWPWKYYGPERSGMGEVSATSRFCRSAEALQLVKTFSGTRRQ
jgi:hypothetical protein